MLRQVQLPQQRLPPGGGVGADQSLFQQIRLGKPQGGRRGLLSLPCGAAAAQGFQQHGGGHPLHAQLALLTALAFAALLAVHVRHIGLQDLLRRQNTLQVIADHKARPVRVRHKDDAAGRRQTAEIGQLLPVVEHGKASRLHDNGVHHLRKSILIVPPLHHDDLPHTGLHRLPASSMRNSFSSASLSIFFSLFIRRSSLWHRMTAV